jgi:hypothetical protein
MRREHGGKTPLWAPPKSKAKSKGSRKSTAKKPQQESPKKKKHGKKFTTSLGMASNRAHECLAQMVVRRTQKGAWQI